MPESPEVQALADFLDTRVTGRAIEEVDILEFRTVKTRSRPPAQLVGDTVTAVRRIGKHVDLRFTDRHLVLTLGRYGWVRWAEPGAPAPVVDDPPPALATIGFDDGGVAQATDAGSWVSLALWVVDDPREVPAIAKLGPDPADPAFSRAEFDRPFVRRRKQVKAILQDQESLAGIGNAYSDEILHTAKVSPVVQAATLSDAELTRLFEATTGVIRETTIARRGIPIDQLKAAKVASMRVHGRTGLACPVCGDTIRDFAFASTTAQYCPTCQTGGALLPD